METYLESINQLIQIFVRRFGVLNATCCDECCGEKVSMAQSHILFEVARNGNASIQRVAEELGIDVTTFSRQVKSLEEKGLLAKKVSPDDRRVSLLYLTDEGRQVLDRINHFMSIKLENIFSRMTEFERGSVARSLALLNDSIAAGLKSSHEGDIIACCK